MKKKYWMLSVGTIILAMSFLAVADSDHQNNSIPVFLEDDQVALAEGSTCSCVPTPYYVCIGYGGVMIPNMKLVCK